jgi:hypothetical protein
MSLFGKVFDIFGNGGNNKFYARDFRNAYTFRPDQNPPRQKFQGYVNFILNRSLFGQQWYKDSAAFRTQISSLVRTASLPEIEFKTETKNSYNRKRIINTGVEYQPVDIKVFDTINNEWLVLFMKYYSYHYMNPRNKQDGSRDGVGGDDANKSAAYLNDNSIFGKESGFNSNGYGYNLNLSSNFFERIDYVVYHGNKGVQYSLFNPVLTRFRTGEIDYSSSDVMEFDMTFEYESFTIYESVNFGLTESDVSRFENARNFKGPAFVPLNLPPTLKQMDVDLLDGYARTVQVQASPTTNPSSAEAVNGSDAQSDQYRAPPPIDSDLAGSPEFQAQVAQNSQSTQTADSAIVVNGKLAQIYGDAATFANPTGKDKSFLGGLLSNVADQALSAAIHGKSVKNAVISTAVGGVVSGITSVIKTPTRGIKTTVQETSGSSAEKQKVTPTEGGGP